MSKFKNLKKVLKEVYVITKICTVPPDLGSYCNPECDGTNCEDDWSEQGNTCMQKGLNDIKKYIFKILPIIKELQQENIDLKRKLHKIKSTLK